MRIVSLSLHATQVPIWYFIASLSPGQARFPPSIRCKVGLKRNDLTQTSRRCVSGASQMAICQRELDWLRKANWTDAGSLARAATGSLRKLKKS
jgi:hypothetical protein